MLDGDLVRENWGCASRGVVGLGFIADPPLRKMILN